jgi:hypothetical protein
MTVWLPKIGRHIEVKRLADGVRRPATITAVGSGVVTAREPRGSSVVYTSIAKGEAAGQYRPR